MSKVVVKDYDIGAGETLTVHQPASFFMIMEATASVDLAVLRAESSIGDAEGVGVGYYFDLPKNEQRFQGVRIYSASAQTLKLCFSDGDSGVKGGSVSVSGTVAISGAVTTNSTPVPYSQGAVTVGVASGLLKAANASRRFLLVQNNHASQNIWLNLAGAAATQAAGVKIPPAGSLLIDQACPTGAVYAIGETGANTTVTVVEG